MTSTEPDITLPPAHPHVVRVGDIPMSALVAEAPRPRAVIVTLHGGATTSSYFDYPDQPRLSLVRTAAALGFTVVALDRPGYGASAAHDSEFGDGDRRTDLAYAAVDTLLDGRERGMGVFLWAHSAGCELALRMAGDPRGDALLGVELAGVGQEHHPEAQRAMDAWRRDPSSPRPRLARTLWDPPHAYAPEMLGGRTIGAPAPAYEGRPRDGWQGRFARWSARVRVPVHLTLAEFEQVWRNGPGALADLAALFTASPRVVVAEQAGAGHNTSVGRTALAYHLRVLSFVEECVAGVQALPAERGSDG